jgi:hypothetical protein
LFIELEDTVTRAKKFTPKLRCVRPITKLAYNVHRLRTYAVYIANTHCTKTSPSPNILHSARSMTRRR